MSLFLECDDLNKETIDFTWRKCRDGIESFGHKTLLSLMDVEDNSKDMQGERERALSIGSIAFVR